MACSTQGQAKARRDCMTHLRSDEYRTRKLLVLHIPLWGLQKALTALVFMVMSDGAAQRFGAEFEEEVKVLLRETLQLSDVKGVADFHIAPEGNHTGNCLRRDRELV